MNISEIHLFIATVLDQEQAGYFTPATIDEALDRSSMWHFNDYKKRYASDVDAYEALAPFKNSIDYSTSSIGVYAVPGANNYLQLLSMDVSVMDAGLGSARRWPVEIVKEDEVAQRRNSQMLPVSATKPIGVETASGTFKLYPEQVHAGTIRFLRRPAKPVFAYTQVGRVITYDSGNSTQLEWTEPYLNQVIFKAIQFLGINLGSEQLQKAAMMLQGANV